LEAGEEILRSEGSEALTLRAVARRAGVSQTAPYRHFADRRALVAAVAERGFERLRRAMEGALTSSDGRAGLRGVAFAYLRFAIDNTAAYRVMFGPELADRSDLPGLRETGRGVLAFVAAGIARLQGTGMVGDGDPKLMAVTTWAMLHGLVSLLLDGQVESVVPDAEALAMEATRIMMFGMAPRGS
jgi:AcrR family transcriptional regulator